MIADQPKFTINLLMHTPTHSLSNTHAHFVVVWVVRLMADQPSLLSLTHTLTRCTCARTHHRQPRRDTPAPIPDGGRVEGSLALCHLLFRSKPKVDSKPT